MPVDIKSEIKRQSLLQYIGGDAKKISAGTYRVNPCPMCGHNDCFTIYETTNGYKCYSCGKSGDIFSYLQDTGQAWDFKTSVEKLAGHFNIKLEPYKADKRLQGGKAIKFETIQAIFDLAAKYYHEQLLGPAGKAAREYLSVKRQRSELMWEQEMYGFAGDRGGLARYLSGLTDNKKAKIYTKEELLASGLIRADDKDGHLYDLFGNGQIIYPVYLNGHVCDFIAKGIDKDKKTAFQLPNEYKLRGCLFYGQEALYKDYLILVEGPEDRNSILELGNYPVAALAGWSNEQFDIISERCKGKTIYACFDTDQQGDKYTYKLAMAAGQGSVIRVIGFDLKYKDIDDYLKSVVEKDRKEYWDGLIKAAKDVIIHRIDTLPEDMSNYDPRMQFTMLDPIIKLISKVDDELCRLKFMEILAERMGKKAVWLPAIKKSVLKEIYGSDAVLADDEFPKAIIKENNQYKKRAKDSNDYIPISEFVMEIVGYTLLENVMQYDVILTGVLGNKSKRVTFNNEQRINTKQFDAVLAGLGPFYFYGSLNDLKQIWQIEEAEANITNTTCEFRKYGYLKEHDVWLFKNCAYKHGKLYITEDKDDKINIDGIGYKSRDVKVYGCDMPELYLKDNTSSKYNIEVINKTWEMWDAPMHGEKPYSTFKGFLVMGYLASVVYLSEIVAKEHKFPFPMSFGPPSCGKSECWQLFMNMFGFKNGGENWGEATPAGISQAMQQLCNIPYWLEEFSNTMGNNDRQKNKVEVIKNIYNRVSSGKGGVNTRLVYEVNAALFLTGQDRPENQAFLTRCVILRKEKPTENGSKAYYWLRADNKRLSLVLRWLLEHKDKDSIKGFFEDLEQIKTVLKEKIKSKSGDYDERIAFNYAIVATGFFRFDYHDYDLEFLNWVADECISNMQRKQSEDMVYKFISDIEVVFVDSLDKYVKKTMSATHSYVYLCYDKIYNEWIRNQKQTGLSEYISKEGLKDYLKKDSSGYWVASKERDGEHRKYFKSRDGESRQQRCICLDVERLPHKIRDIIDVWNLTVEYE